MSIRRNFRQGGHGRITPAATHADSGLSSARDRGRPALAAAMLTAALAAAPAGKASAKEAERDYDIPAQSLNNALMAFAAGSDLELVFTADTVRGRSSPGLSGRMTPKQGLNRLLAGSGVDYRYVEGRTVTLERRPAEAVPERVSQADSSDLALPTVKVTEKTAYDSTDPYNKDYKRPDATTATKTDTPIMQTPVSVQVVPRAVINDQQAIQLQDVVKNVSGVQFSAPGVDVYQDGFIIRGFDTNEHTYRNGLRQTSLLFEPANFERVEVLKGPSGTLYGRAQPGGLINVVTKLPLADPYYSVQQQFGSYDLYRTSLDATGPIDEDRSFLYRANLAYKSNNSFRDFVDFERIMFAPSVSWLVSDQTRIDLSVEYQHEDYGAPYSFPVLSGGMRPALLPWGNNQSEPFSHHENDKTVLEFAWSHRFNEDWILRNRFQGQFQDYQQLEIYSTGLQEDNRSMNRALYDVLQDRTTYATNLDLIGKFETWDVKHDVLLGFDYYNFTWNADGHCCTAGEDVAPIDIFNPVHGGIDWKSIVAGPKDFFYRVDEEWKGFYFQDQLSAFDDQIHLLAGGRHDWVTAGSGFSGNSFSEANAQLNGDSVDYGRFSPRVGILYQPRPWMSFYVNYSESFGSNNSGRSASGQPLAPETSKQYEAGVKFEAFGGRLRSTLAAYEITKNNVLTPNNATPDPTDYALIGKARSKGIEVDVQGEIDEHWSVIAGYAYNDARVAGSDPLKGNLLPRAPENSANSWVKYQFTDGWLEGLSLGTGVFLASDRQGDLANSFQLPGYARWDMAAAYAVRLGDSRLTTRLNVNNVLDKQYFASSISRRSSIPADPLTILGSVQVEF